MSEQDEKLNAIITEAIRINRQGAGCFCPQQSSCHTVPCPSLDALCVAARDATETPAIAQAKIAKLEKDLAAAIKMGSTFIRVGVNCAAESNKSASYLLALGCRYDEVKKVWERPFDMTMPRTPHHPGSSEYEEILVDQTLFPDPVRIWSNEHNAWWRPNSCGYTVNWYRAGIYSAAEGKEIVSRSHNDNIMVPAADHCPHLKWGGDGAHQNLNCKHCGVEYDKEIHDYIDPYEEAES